MLKLVRMIQKLKNDKNRDDSLLFQTAHISSPPQSKHTCLESLFLTTWHILGINYSCLQWTSSPATYAT